MDYQQWIRAGLFTVVALLLAATSVCVPAAGQGKELVAACANEGIGYDALDTISTMIEAAPGDSGLVESRATLLDPIGLQAVTGN